jgi:CBS domain-containing protein
MEGLAMMRVQGMMQHEVVSAPPDLSLAEALDLMQQHHIRHLPVVSGQQIIGHHRIGCLPVVSSDGTLNGIVTVRDLIRAHVQQYEASR